MTVQAFQVGRCQNVLAGAKVGLAIAKQQQEAVAVAHGHVDVVQRHANTAAIFPGQFAQQVKNADLVVQVEMIGWFIKQVDLRVLRQQGRQVKPSLFTAGQGISHARFHAGQAGLMQRLGGTRPVIVGLPLQCAQPGMPANQCRFHHRCREGIAMVLQQYADTLRDSFARQCVQRVVVQENVALVCPAQPAQRMQKGGLSCPVTPEDAPAFT